MYSNLDSIQWTKSTPCGCLVMPSGDAAMKKLVSIAGGLYKLNLKPPLDRVHGYTKIENPEMQNSGNRCHEIDLARRICGGDQQAFRIFYQLSSSRVFAFLLLLTRDGGLAKELMQDTYIKFWQGRRWLNDINYPRSYLVKIAGRVFFQHKNKVSPVQVPITVLNDEEILTLGKEAGIEGYIEARDFYVQVDKVVEALPKQQRRVFRLVIFEKLSYKKVAAVLGISESAVSNYLEVAREKVQCAVLKLDVNS